MKYKVGDKVRVRSDLEVGKIYDNGVYFDSGMKCHKGKIVTIQEITYYKTYIIKEDSTIFKFNWTDDMFEGKVEDMDIEIEKMINEKVEEFKQQLIEETKKLVEEQKQKEEVFPKVGDEYYYVNDYGVVLKEYCWENDDIDNARLAIGNVFKTREEAEFALEKLKVITELKKFAEPKDRKWDENGDIKHWYIGWNYDKYSKKGIRIRDKKILKHNDIYFESEAKALEAIESVGEERVKKYYLEVEE